VKLPLIKGLGRNLVVILAMTLTLGVARASVTTPAHAVTGSDWRAGNIIDDGIFYDNTSMSAQDIQNFLNGKVPVCDTNGTKTSEWGGGTRAQYGTSRGYPPPYTCLKDYSQNGQSAAQIIKSVSDTYNINPKTLIILLQKEQTLVTDDWPWSNQYRSATGYGCPDTAACDSQYYGFYNQVMNAARQFRLYANNPQSYRYKPYQNNTIQFNPNAGCGSSTVYIENKATAGLYNYTPYQPNASALSNLYGSGDGCGAYGNRNFWRLFNDWFGSTNAPRFRASYVSQSGYPIIDSGLGVSVYFNFQNTGTQFWKDDLSNFPGYRPTRLAATSPINRASGFSASNWPSPSRPTGIFSKVYESDGVTLASDQHTVQPGQIARFEFTIYANPSIPPGVYREYFQPVIEGAPGYDWNIGGGVYLDIGVNRPRYQASYVGQSAYPTISRGSSSAAYLTVQNVGRDPWFDDVDRPFGKRPVHLATSWPINRASSFSGTWPSVSRPNLLFSKVYESDGVTLASAQHTVQPGQIVKFEFTLIVPINATPGTYREYFQPVIEGAPGQDWDMGLAAWLGITVQ